MTEIGHNQPPAFEAHSLNIEDLFTLISGTTAGAQVSTDAQEEALDDLLDDVRKARKAADADRAAEKKPHDDAAAAVQARWKPLLAKCDMAMLEIKKLLTPYREAKAKAREAAAAKAREEAAEKMALAQEKLSAPDDLEAKFEAETQFAAAKKLTAAANKIDRSPTGLRTHWEAEITDQRAALNHYIKRSPERFRALIQQLADEDARGSRGLTPGVLFHERKRAA